MDDKARIKKFIPIMNEVSPTFCLAKWHHTTIYLGTGETHSCYHPAPHSIPLEEIAEDPEQNEGDGQVQLVGAELFLHFGGRRVGGVGDDRRCGHHRDHSEQAR